MMTGTSPYLVAPRGALLDQLAMRGGLALVAWSLHRAGRGPAAEPETARLAREHTALKRRALLLPPR